MLAARRLGEGFYRSATKNFDFGALKVDLVLVAVTRDIVAVTLELSEVSFGFENQEF